MALQCQISVNYASYTAGQNPPPMATIQVYNPGAASVAVTGCTLNFTDQFGNRVTPATNAALPAIGAGQTVVVPTLSSINIGPFPIVCGSAANGNSFQMVSPGAQPPNAQPSQPLQSTLVVGAIINGSDGSSNVAGSAAVLVSYTSTPPLGYQGGFFQFAAPNNFIGLTPGWP